MRSKFLLTQLSGLVVGLAALIVVGAYLPRLLAPNAESFEEFSPILAFLYVVIVVAAVPISMALWGRVLVKFRFLTAEEAKDYPYSRPWEH